MVDSNRANLGVVVVWSVRMTIIRLNEEGFPLKANPTFPRWLMVAHVALVVACGILILLN